MTGQLYALEINKNLLVNKMIMLSNKKQNMIELTVGWNTRENLLYIIQVMMSFQWTYLQQTQTSLLHYYILTDQHSPHYRAVP